MGKSTVSSGSWRDGVVGTGQPWPAAVKTVASGAAQEICVCTGETVWHDGSARLGSRDK